MDYREKSVDGRKVTFSADWINDLERREHFNWYHSQAQLIYQQCSREDKIIEIGVGAALLYDMMKRRGWDFSSLDIDADKNPDFLCSADDFDYAGHHVDVVVAFEVFEHIPLSTLKKVLAQIADSKVKMIGFSVPWNERRRINFQLKIPRLKKISYTNYRELGVIKTQTHFWELAKRAKELDDGKHLVSPQQLHGMFDEIGFDMELVSREGYVQFATARRK